MKDALALSPEEIAKLPLDGGPDFNRLVFEQSPYLLQHATNPVDWYPWGEEVLNRARSEDKPVFLSIGYSTCHWCHVMERESFEDEEVAALLNEHFIAIKVDLAISFSPVFGSSNSGKVSKTSVISFPLSPQPT